MSFKKILIYSFVIFFFLGVTRQKALAQNTNLGFVKENIWYSKDPFIEGDKIKIYTLLFNPEERRLDGTVFFTSNGENIGEKSFSIKPGNTKILYIKWTAKEGSHEIYAKIKDAFFYNEDGSSERAEINDTSTQKSTREVLPNPDAKEDENFTNNIINIINSEKISEPLQEIGSKAIEEIPTPAKEASKNLLSQIDSFRQNTLQKTENKKEETFQKISQGQKEDEKKENENTTRVETEEVSTKENTNKENFFKETINRISIPLQSVKLFFLNLASKILESTFLFYIVSLLIIVILFRTMKRLIFKNSYE